jgi:hypothetical protein
VLTGTLSLVLPVASPGIKLAMDEAAEKSLENYFDFGKEVIDASLGGSEKIGDWLGGSTSTRLGHGDMIRAHGATLREFRALLKAKDPDFGGLVRVRNKCQEFLWVHERFEAEY